MGVATAGGLTRMPRLMRGEQGMAIKKRYSKPLVTEVKLKPEEAVLTACKKPNVRGMGHPRSCTVFHCHSTAS